MEELCKSISYLIEINKYEKACRALQLFLLVIPLNYRILLLKLLLFINHTINYNILGGIVKIEFVYRNLYSCIFTEDYQVKSYITCLSKTCGKSCLCTTSIIVAIVREQVPLRGNTNHRLHMYLNLRLHLYLNLRN